ncbi:RloB family protein [Aliikangiella maris]|uniref:RloB family protein n=2 Tax=Aliikangiella maris TaxID=3162458 RepID=A0ABV3MPY6_9GAMM
MGTDNLFHKRKAKSIQDLRRRKAKKEAYEKILIVCEGEKTEPSYFSEIKDKHELNSANIDIVGDCDSCPTAIVEFAKKKYKEEKDLGDPYDKVFCVFDRDTHAKYESAITLANKSKPSDTFVIINSVPCFEYWLILHFDFRTRPYSPLPGKSMGQQIISELKQFLPNYSKGDNTIFSQTESQLQFAKANASRGLKQAQRNNTDNPSTKIHILVEYLENLKK